MKWSTHFIVGATIGLIFAKYTGMEYILMASAGALFGVLPDADIILSALHIAEHRGAYSHSLGSSVIMAIITSPIVYLFFDFTIKESAYLGALAFTASFFHTLADTMTYSGTRALWPLSDKKYRGFVRFNNIPANLFIIVLCIVLLYFLGFFSGGLSFVRKA